MIDMSYFRTIQGSTDVESEADWKAQEAKRRLQRELESSINFGVAKRNGVEQKFVINASESKYKYDIVAMPDDDLFVGDHIEFGGEHFVVTQVRDVSPIQHVGLMWECNLKLRFQNWSSDIIERWCVFDSGQYSSTRSGDSTITVIDATRNIYISGDDDTNKIFVNKRIAVATMYNQNGEEILECFEIVGRSLHAKTYGQNAHLITLTVESSLYNEDTDSIEEMICDYIEPDGSSDDTEEDKLTCVITGRSTLSSGSTRTYNATFYDADGNECTVDDIVWSVSGFGTITADAARCKVTADSSESSIGEVIELTVCDTAGLYNPATYGIEVVG